MPTTTSTTTPSRKPAAKKAAARKPAAKKAAARKPAAKEAAARKPAAKKAAASATPVAKDLGDRAEVAVTDAVKFMRDATHTYMGMGRVVQRRLINRDATDKLTVESFLQESKAKGHDMATEIQDRFEPIIQRINDRFEPITDRIESNLPTPVKEAIETSRERVRKLLAA